MPIAGKIVVHGAAELRLRPLAGGQVASFDSDLGRHVRAAERQPRGAARRWPRPGSALERGRRDRHRSARRWSGVWYCRRQGDLQRQQLDPSGSRDRSTAPRGSCAAAGRRRASVPPRAPLRRRRARRAGGAARGPTSMPRPDSFSADCSCRPRGRQRRHEADRQPGDERQREGEARAPRRRGGLRRCAAGPAGASEKSARDAPVDDQRARGPRRRPTAASSRRASASISRRARRAQRRADGHLALARACCARAAGSRG